MMFLFNVFQTLVRCIPPTLTTGGGNGQTRRTVFRSPVVVVIYLGGPPVFIDVHFIDGNIYAGQMFPGGRGRCHMSPCSPQWHSIVRPPPPSQVTERATATPDRKIVGTET